MAPPQQAKLLRVLQEKQLERLGSNQVIDVDLRIIAATNREPREAVREQRLREDLYYRLNVLTIQLPSLREHPDDIPELVAHFIMKHSSKANKPPTELTQDTLCCLQRYSWPGNVRELENVIERALVLCRSSEIQPHDLPLEISQGKLTTGPHCEVAKSERQVTMALKPQLEAMEKELIQQAIQRAGGKAGAARLLEISERAFWYKVRKYHLH